MKIAILGGAFSPFTKTHLEMAQVLNYFSDQIWIIPAFKHADKDIEKSWQHRYNMIVEGITDSGLNIRINNIEKELQSNQTITTTRHLIKEYPQHEFCMALGEDNARNIHHWGEYKDLIKLLPFIVFPRGKWGGYCWFHGGPHTYLRGLKLLHNCSSTDFRNAIKENKLQKAKEMVPAEIYNYVIKHGLYK